MKIAEIGYEHKTQVMSRPQVGWAPVLLKAQWAKRVRCCRSYEVILWNGNIMKYKILPVGAAGGCSFFTDVSILKSFMEHDAANVK